MLQIYFSEIVTVWSKDKLDEMMMPLPNDMQSKILSYKGWKERQSRVLGKRMLIRLLAIFDPSLTLGDLKYTQFNKPYFGVFDFSIAHSEDMVVCAGIKNAHIGVDIEKILPIELTDYEDQLTANEWEHIHHAPDIQKAFFEIWTKKEALLKALGIGVDMDLNNLDVCSDKVDHDGISYWFYPLTIAENYIAHMATNVPIDPVSIRPERHSDDIG